jgi:4-hydroxybenzoate polyprenyltransferase
MGMNRYADRHLDRLNPRTQDRALPQGRISGGKALVFVAGSYGLFLLATWMLSWLCFALSPLAILIISGYSYTKRFTSLSHLVLGLSLALAPLGAWIAIAGHIALPAVVLGGAVVFWVAGFDILYALMDIDVDRRSGLFSIPVRLGVDGGIVIARLFHALTIVFLGFLIPLLKLGSVYTVGLLLASTLLVYEQWLLHRHGLAKLNVAFFNVNGALSIGMFLFTLGDLLLG